MGRNIGVAVMIHVILITLFFLEIFIYSTIINLGHTKKLFESHATITAPYVATITWFVLIYLFVV